MPDGAVPGRAAQRLAERPVTAAAAWCTNCVVANNTCKHDGFHSGEGRYDAATRTLRYVMICDACRSEVREVLVQQYMPEFHAGGDEDQIAA
jgi:hypothetical protein